MSNWNICEDYYPGPSVERLKPPNTGTFTVAGQITMPMQPHLSRVPLLKVGDVYFESGRPLGIITSVDYADQTFTMQPQGTYVR